MTCAESNQSTFLGTPSFYDGSNILNDFDTKEAALAVYDQAIRLSPQEAVFYQHKGHILERLGRLVEAREAYEAARQLGY